MDKNLDVVVVNEFALARAWSTSWLASGEVIDWGETNPFSTSSTSWFAMGVVIEHGVIGSWSLLVVVVVCLKRDEKDMDHEKVSVAMTDR